MKLDNNNVIMFDFRTQNEKVYLQNIFEWS